MEKSRRLIAAAAKADEAVLQAPDWESAGRRRKSRPLTSPQAPWNAGTATRRVMLTRGECVPLGRVAVGAWNHVMWWWSVGRQAAWIGTTTLASKRAPRTGPPG